MTAAVRQAMLLQRVGFGPDAMTAPPAPELATLAAAKGFNRAEMGILTPGTMATRAAFDLNQTERPGHDLAPARVFCNPEPVAYSIVNGPGDTATWSELTFRRCCVSITNRPVNGLVGPIRHFITEATKNKADYICYCSHYSLEYALPVIRENQRLD
ncbi:hypothetical protein [Pantoea brenneri]|uniref:hypothetical protein n=1 Tax=Pantoea brenneri TaxID=472694 RepID=UPI00289E8765|nr:hypothetical protein [Pantoea brenneri]